MSRVIKQIGKMFPPLKKGDFHDMGDIYIMHGTDGKEYVGQAHCQHFRTVNESLIPDAPHGAPGRITEHIAEAFGRHPDKNCRKLNAAIRKHGCESFTWEVLERVHESQMNDVETAYIALFDCVASGYNLKEGGKNGRLSAETKALISKAHKENPPFKGKHHSEGTKKAIANKNTANANEQRPPDHKGDPVPPYIKHINHADRQGYGVLGHPSMKGVTCGAKKKEFVSKKMTMDEKLALAVAYAASLDADAAAVNAAKQTRVYKKKAVVDAAVDDADQAPREASGSAAGTSGTSSEE